METVLTGSTELTSGAALAYAQQYMPPEGITTVDATLDGPVLVIRPRIADSEHEERTTR